VDSARHLLRRGVAVLDIPKEWHEPVFELEQLYLAFQILQEVLLNQLFGFGYHG